MTDRCMVNQATIRLISKAWNTSLHVIYCHLHPLDTISSEVKKVLRNLEDMSETRQVSKSGCVIEQILAAFDRLR